MGRPRKKTEAEIQSLFQKEITPKEAFRRIRNYLAGQFVGATRDDALLDEVVKCLFCKLAIENGSCAPVDIKADTFQLAKDFRAIFSKVRTNFPEVFDLDAEILLDPEALKFVMSTLSFSVMDAHSDPIGDAFEIFVGSESKGNSGQFFTPRSVTSLLVGAINPLPHETILDPACGAGGFLSSVCAHYLNKGVAPNQLCETTKNFYGIDKDAYLAKLAKAHIALLTNGHPHIFCGDSISMQNGTGSIKERLPEGGVDVILTNPPFGVRIVAAKPQVLKEFQLARRWNSCKKTGILTPTEDMLTNVPPQVLFVERCLSLLRPGGRLGMVLPESILSNKSYRQVVEYLFRNSDIHAVMGMPEALFKTSGKGGTHTKTCLILATKAGNNNARKSIFMAEAKWCGQDSRARVIPNNDLPAIATNFQAYYNGVDFKQSSLGFVLEKDRISGNVLCPRYYDPVPEQELDALKSTHTLITFGDLVSEGVFELNTGDEIGKLAYGTGTIPFIRTSDISNWELKADPKHGVSREIYETLSKKQNVQPEDILMVKDGTYLIGTCAIVTEADKEMLYQSHLYKIRVKENAYGLNPYLLIAILSSPVVQKQIKAKQFTQDIIDSLGERIKELVLPIPKDEAVRQNISSLVKKSSTHRIEARALASEALSVVAVLPQRGI